MERNNKRSRREFLRGHQLEREDPHSGQLPSKSEALDRHQRLQAEYLQHFSKRAMACDFEIFFNLNQYDQATEATLAAFQLIDDLENRLSVYISDSEVSQLNQSKGQPFAASKELVDVLGKSQTLYQDTHGAFDITSTPLSKAWGFYQRQGGIPPHAKIDEALRRVAANRIELVNHSVRFSDPNLEINLNSIGKGFALDEAAAVIRGFGVHDFVLHGGQSSVVARGHETNELNLNDGWTVGLSHPFVPNHRLAQIVLRNQSLSTSGTARQGFYHQGRRYGHVIDPRTGWPTDHFLSATVVSDCAATCDALATAFFVMSLEDVQAYCDSHTQVAAILVVPESKSGAVEIETFNVSDELLRLQ